MTSTTYIYGLYCPASKKVRYVGKADKPIQRARQHLAQVARFKRRVYFRKLFPAHPSIPPLPRTPKMAWLLSLDRRGLKPQLVILEEVPLFSWRSRERYWTERLIRAGHGPTNGERASFDAQRAEERAMQDAISAGRRIAVAVGISS